MKSIIESYVGIWIILIFTLISTAFLNIHLNVIQARRITNEIKTEVQATNGAGVPIDTNTYKYDSSEDNLSFDDGSLYCYNYTIERCTITDKREEGQTYIYNDVYKINLNYHYIVPLFGEQIYPVTTYTY